LRNQDVGAGDLFLFWGLFRPVEKQHGRWRYVGRPIHAIFGWLEVDCVLAHPGGGLLESYPWLDQHPHVQHGWGAANALYLARERLSARSANTLPGFGVFRRLFQLTAPDAPSKSVWQVPEWLHPHAGGVGMTHHPAGRWLADGRLRSAPRGQEFVAQVSRRPDAVEWAISLIEAHR
jgi:hypothetical protein